MVAWSLGIDLGTSFSAGAVATEDRVDVLAPGGERRVPSSVALTDTGELLAGTWAQRYVGSRPERVERNPKRYVGRGPMLLGGEQVSAERAMAALIGLFLGEARHLFDRTSPSSLVLTHPVAWSAAQRGQLRAAAGMAAPDVPVHLVAEPVAAAMHYADEHRLADGDTVAVYDLGGGTFDTAVLSVSAAGFQVVGQPGGDPDIGGEAFDQRVYDHLGAQLQHSAPDWWSQVRSSPDRQWLAAGAGLLTIARSAKEELSEHDRSESYVQGPNEFVRITRTEFDEMIGRDVSRTAALLTETISGSGGTDRLRGIYLTGGASRTPLVEDTVRGTYADLVHTWQDPKTVVALGAARWARHHAAPAAPATSTAAAPVEVASPVGDARVAAGALYVLGPGPSAGSSWLRRIRPSSGRVDRDVLLGDVVGWAVSDDGMLVAERRGEQVRVAVFTPELTIRSTREISTPHDPVLLVHGPAGWVFTERAVQAVDNTSGLAWGLTGDLAVRTIDLRSTFVDDARGGPLGTVARWFVNEDGQQRRLLDPTTSTGSLPYLVGDTGRCGAVLGHVSRPGWPSRVPGLRPGGQAAAWTSRLAGRRGGTAQNVELWQVVVSIDAAGTVGQLIEQRPSGPGMPWLHQIDQVRGDPTWYVATSEGLEVLSGPSSQRRRQVVVPRSRGGAVRWVTGPTRTFGVAMREILPNSGVSVHVRHRSGTADVGPWPGLLGNLASARPDEAPRYRVVGDALWLGVADGEGGSQIVEVTPGGARVLGGAPGWLEPIGEVDGARYALHAPGTVPGDRRTEPGALVRLP